MKQRANARKGKRGIALLAALFAAFVAVTAVSVLMTLSFASNTKADVDRHRSEARYLAEGTVEAVKKMLQTAIANWEPLPTAGAIAINGQSSTYTVTPTGLDTIATDSAGIQTLVTGYEIEARAQSHGGSTVVHRIVNAEATPIFQFAVFYTDDLEIFPGPSMTLGGRVHSNADTYLGCGNTLTVNTNYLRSVGGIYRHRKDNPGVSDGTVNVRKWVQNPYDVLEPVEYFTMYSRSQMDDQGVTTISGYDSNFEGLDLNGDEDYDDLGEWLPWAPGSLEFWGPPDDYPVENGNTVLTQDHGIGEAVVPHIGSIAMFQESDAGDFIWDPELERYVATTPGDGTHEKGFFHDNADLSIITYGDGTWDAFDGSGFSVKASLTGAVTQTAIYDARQASGSGEKTPVTQIDIAALNASGAFPTNGLLYSAHYGLGEGTNAKGVVLTNGAELSAPLNVVTEGAMYVHGDYNLVNKKGAAVIGDAVNLLSNAWDGTKSPGNLPAADHTTYNLAIVTGNHETHVGTYNGGLENLPRFHENWGSKNCNINGSFVNTWFSQYATGQWVYGSDRYKAPRRNWFYDPAFNSVANLPPFTPMAVSADDIVSW